MSYWGALLKKLNLLLFYVLKFYIINEPKVKHPIRFKKLGEIVYKSMGTNDSLFSRQNLHYRIFQINSRSSDDNMSLKNFFF